MWIESALCPGSALHADMALAYIPVVSVNHIRTGSSGYLFCHTCRLYSVIIFDMYELMREADLCLVRNRLIRDGEDSGKKS